VILPSDERRSFEQRPLCVARTEVAWPDFTPARFRSALHEYGRRQRHFGELPAAVRANGA
jgi:hypothetical protein